MSWQNQNTTQKNWGHGSSGRELAQQEWDPVFNYQYKKKKSKKTLSNGYSPIPGPLPFTHPIRKHSPASHPLLPNLLPSLGHDNVCFPSSCCLHVGSLSFSLLLSKDEEELGSIFWGLGLWSAMLELGYRGMKTYFLKDLVHMLVGRHQMTKMPAHLGTLEFCVPKCPHLIFLGSLDRWHLGGDF
jgi:hypothetical protein